MAEAPLKRQREETHVVEDSNDPKRPKSYNHLLSLLDEEEDEPNQDLTSVFATLQRELSSGSANFDDSSWVRSSDADHTRCNPTEGSTTATSEFNPASDGVVREDQEEDEGERVMKHLLEASDDELGIPQRVDGGDDEELINGGDVFGFCDGLWDLEDEGANYYTLLQSELFM